MILKNTYRAITFLLILSLVFSISPVTAFASENAKNHSLHHNHSGEKTSTHHIETVIDGTGISVALLDSGITDFPVSKRAEFVKDEARHPHGNQMAQVLLENAPGVTLMDARILDSKGIGKHSAISSAIYWAVHNGADIIVMSFAGTEGSTILEAAINYAANSDVLMIASAGNDGKEIAVYPAAYSSVLSVGALDENLETTAGTNRGPYVDYFAVAQGGTSHAAQVVAAQAAKLMQMYPNKSAQEIRLEMTGAREKPPVHNSMNTDLSVQATACAHNRVVSTSNPTCTVNGRRRIYCSKCGYTHSRVTLYALGHTWSSYRTTKNATCTSAGTQVRNCTRCGTSQSASIAKLSHIAKSTPYYTLAPTCTAGGYSSYNCSRCNTFVKTVFVDKLGHNKSSTWTTKVAATCTATGTKVKKCTRCSAELETATITKLGHIVESTPYYKLEPTCTVGGYSSYNCIRCKKFMKTVLVDALGHKKSSTWTTTTEPTCLSDGTKAIKCTRCSSELETETIEKLGHVAESTPYFTLEPTCTVDGYSSYNCVQCGDFAKTVFFDALGHRNAEIKDNSVVCTICTGILMKDVPKEDNIKDVRGENKIVTDYAFAGYTEYYFDSQIAKEMINILDDPVQAIFGDEVPDAIAFIQNMNTVLESIVGDTKVGLLVASWAAEGKDIISGVNTSIAASELCIAVEKLALEKAAEGNNGIIMTLTYNPDSNVPAIGFRSQ